MIRDKRQAFLSPSLFPVRGGLNVAKPLARCVARVCVRFALPPRRSSLRSSRLSSISKPPRKSGRRFRKRFCTGQIR